MPVFLAMKTTKHDNQKKEQNQVAAPGVAPRWDSGGRWDSGLRWPGGTPQTNNKRMAIVITNISGLNVADKTQKGGTIISMSTDNPLVPGNGPTLAAFQARQAALVSRNALVLTTRELLRQQTADRDSVELEWDDACLTLAAFTQTATDGNEVAILSTGFGVRRPNTPKPPLTAPTGLTVSTNGAPGKSKLRWVPVDGAVSYLVECGADPESGFAQVLAPTKTNVEVGGAVPGKVCWFRVAAIGAGGQGPWCTPVQRPVM